jgi:NAD(P)-dependent dehydrogenase (short-subunit alcohol dehydrogenase family)
MPTYDYQDKVAIVTGGGSGIGEAVALTMAANGAKVVVADYDQASGERVVKEVQATGGEATFIDVDVSKPDQVEKMVSKAIEVYGKLDVAVNNAGVGGPSAQVGEYPIDGWKTVISVNLDGVFYGMRYQIPAMLDSGGGSIVNMASILGSVGFANAPAYVAAKHGVVGLTKAAAVEYSARGIRINSVGPGFINTPLLEENLDEETLGALAGMHPIQRLGNALSPARRPPDVAHRDTGVPRSPGDRCEAQGLNRGLDASYTTEQTLGSIRRRAGEAQLWAYHRR